MGRIIYICNWTGESGGIKLLYDHVRLLRRRGHDAVLGSYGEFARCAWFRSSEATTPAVSSFAAGVRPHDIVVIPEICAWDREVRSLDCRKLVFVQNPDVLSAPLASTGCHGVLVSSRPVIDWLRRDFDFHGPIHFVPGFLEDRYVQARRRAASGEPRILLIDRPCKHKGEPRLVRDFLRARGIDPTYISTPMPRDAFVAMFREHDAYLHASYHEGFPTPVIEAFGAGCLVLGFSGRGGEEFMRHGENCWLFPDGDWVALSAAGARLRELDGVAWNRCLQSACDTASQYSERRMESALDATFRTMQSVRGPSAAITPILSG